MCRWMLKATAVAGLCCGVWNGGDGDVGGGGGGVLCGDGRTCVGSCDGGGDCCVVVVGKVAAVWLEHVFKVFLENCLLSHIVLENLAF